MFCDGLLLLIFFEFVFLPLRIMGDALPFFLGVLLDG